MRFVKRPQPRDCAWCGRHYRPLALNGKYCTAGCCEAAARDRARAYRAKIKPAKAERTCAACGKAFVPSHGSALACSDECKQERHRQTKSTWYGTLSRAKPKTRTCLACGALFEASGHRMRAVTCSPECSYLRSRERTRQSKIDAAAQDPDIDAIIKRKGSESYSVRKQQGTVQHRTVCKVCLGALPRDGTSRTTCSLQCAGKARAYGLQRGEA
jgi:predicted nucleic acid-binding Zn ribbon protein